MKTDVRSVTLMKKSMSSRHCEVAADNYQIPLMVGHYKEAWMFGREAQRAAMMDKGWVVSDLYRKAQRNEQIDAALDCEARWLLENLLN